MKTAAAADQPTAALNRATKNQNPAQSSRFVYHCLPTTHDASPTQPPAAALGGRDSEAAGASLWAEMKDTNRRDARTHAWQGSHRLLYKISRPFPSSFAPQSWGEASKNYGEFPARCTRSGVCRNRVGAARLGKIGLTLRMAAPFPLFCLSRYNMARHDLKTQAFLPILTIRS